MKKILKKHFNFFLAVGLVLFAGIILVLSVRGSYGNPQPHELLSPSWRENGPFELSPERGRFALLYSIIENNSVTFSLPIAEFAAPDVGVSNGEYVSIFAPGLSYLIIPGYVIGRYFGASQVGAFAMISIFALCNIFLLRAIAIRLGANKWAATIASLIFLFGTPAFAYAVNLYQHHVSTFLLLISIYALLRLRTIPAMLVVFFAFACSIPLDYPNLFFLSPVALYAGFNVFSLEKIRSRINITFNVYKALTVFVMIIPIFLFLWFNKISYGNPFQLSGTVQSADFSEGFKEQVQKDTKDDPFLEVARADEDSNGKSAVGFFKTRNLIRGFYIHLFSPDRGVLYYAPVVLFGIIGFILALRKRSSMVEVLIAVVAINILLYSMWGDPWGGWAFGSRYLIPTYAVLSIFVALFLTYWKKYWIVLILFTAVSFYSIAVNTLGAITTSALPPKIQVLSLEQQTGKVEKYTYARNWDFLNGGHSKSFTYDIVFNKYLSSVEFYYLLTGLICVFLTLNILFLAKQSKKGGHND